MRWLPAIRFQNAGWLLPLGVESAELLAAVICDTTENQGSLADPDWMSMRMADQLTSDPSLAIFSLLELLARHPESAGKKFDVESHASWFSSVVFDLFRDGNRQILTDQLAAKLESRSFPEPTFCWPALFDRTFALPPNQWMETAHDWLRETGPTAPEAWHAAWPGLNLSVDELDDTDLDGSSPEADAQKRPNYSSGSLDLFRLARSQNELRLLRDRFATKLHIEKLASLRQLAYGLSHEINNPLAAIRTRSEQLQAEEHKPERVARLQKIVDSAMRAHEMIADMMYFAKPPQPDFRKLDPIALTQQIACEFQSLPEASNLVIRIGVASELNGKIQADESQIADALRALIRNAIEAIEGQGTISISIGRSKHRFVWTVTDSGPGLSEEARRHAFDPFFSGREAGRGLGLGLCRVYRVARTHGGGAKIEGTEVGCQVRMWVRVTP